MLLLQLWNYLINLIDKASAFDTIFSQALGSLWLLAGHARLKWVLGRDSTGVKYESIWHKNYTKWEQAMDKTNDACHEVNTFDGQQMKVSWV